MTERLAILTYHSVDESGSVLSTAPDTLAQQMACLSHLGIRGVSLGQALAEAENLGQWPERTVALTFDDGYENNLTLAQPILAEHGFSATLYVITGHVNGEHDWEVPPPDLGHIAVLDWEQVAELAAKGWEIGAHTRTHPDLRALRPESVEQEIAGSRNDIEARLGRTVTSFAYPGGFVSKTASTIVAREFEAGCTTELRRAQHMDERPLLPRVDAYYVRDLDRFRRLALGKLDGYLTLRRLGRRIKGR